MASERCVLGVDVGGTFTDFTLIRLSDAKVFYHKTPSTPDDPSRAVGDGIEELLARTSVDAADIGYFGHGTTVATNALITGGAAATGLITTDGFRDVLDIRRQRQPPQLRHSDAQAAAPGSPPPAAGNPRADLPSGTAQRGSRHGGAGCHPCRLRGPRDRSGGGLFPAQLPQPGPRGGGGGGGARALARGVHLRLPRGYWRSSANTSASAPRSSTRRWARS